MKNLSLKKVLVVVGLIVLGTSIYFNYRYYEFVQNPEKVAQNEIQKTLEKVSRLIVLPNDETPNVATVADPNALKDQPFFANALKDDQVIVYAKAQKAILYRPSIDKIIEVAPVNIDNTAQQNQTIPEQVQTPKEDVEPKAQ